jgi:hypothetical protein
VPGTLDPCASDTVTWCAPRRLDWWTGALFSVGAAFFALGSAPYYSHAVGGAAASLTFFFGSIWFTTAAFLQFLDAWEPDRGLTGALCRLGWWAALVQLAGTLFFNLSTFKAMHANLTASQADHLVWRPDAYGSTCFIVASCLAWVAVNHRVLRWTPGETPWRIAALNLLGSVAFALSAVADYVVPTSGNPLNVALVSLGTFTGALCFLAGAVLMLPHPAGPE